MRPHPDYAARGRIGGLVTRSRYSGTEITQAARDKFRASFELLVDPNGALDPLERATRAAAARKAHYVALARKSVAARRGAA